MAHIKFLAVLVLIIQIACIPPVHLFLPNQPKPFQGVSENDPVAMGQLTKESSRFLNAQGRDALSGVIDALMMMGCTISTSDPTNRYVTFERIRKEPVSPPSHKGLGYDSAVITGTLKLAPAANGFMCTLVLTGKIHWRTQKHGINTEVFPRLSPDDHKWFFDELLAKI